MIKEKKEINNEKSVLISDNDTAKLYVQFLRPKYPKSLKY